MTPQPFRWLGSPRERMHAFIDGRDRSICQMVMRTPDTVWRPNALHCAFCKRGVHGRLLRKLIEEVKPAN